MKIVPDGAVLTIFICVIIGLVNAQAASRICKTFTEFRCLNGECIASDLLCDGQAHCSDQSDETHAECTKPQFICPTYAFRCSYGACIDSDAICNGIDDCVDGSDELLSRCRSMTMNNSSVVKWCSKDEFRCKDGQCVAETGYCDGTVDCADRSDESRELCSYIQCPIYSFRCTYGACIDLNLRCDGIANCADGSDEDSEFCSELTSSNITTSQPETTLPPQSTIAPSIPQPSPQPVEPTRHPSCSIPPQPQNGYWQLYRCIDNDTCNVQNNVPLMPGTRLVYHCNDGYKIRGSKNVFCSREGTWFKKPVCAHIHCKPLNTASIEVTSCSYHDQRASCSAAVLPQTVATISCRAGLHQESRVLTTQPQNVMCNSRGKWKPEPIHCVPNPQIVNVDLTGAVINVQEDIRINPTTAKPITARHSTDIVFPDDIDVRMGPGAS